MIWAAADARAKGFLLGGTAGRTTLNGEGLQHQDGHSLLNAIAFPTVRAYDPAYAYETAVILFDGLKKLYEENETAIYYLTLENENYEMPSMPEGCEEGIIRGMYRVREAGEGQHRVTLLGSGPILRETLTAADVLGEKFGVAADVWSVTSYTELRRDAAECERWNRLHPADKPRTSYIEEQLAAVDHPVVAASDHVQALAEQIDPWVPGGLYALGTDGMGRSESREALRRHFEVDAPSIAIAALYQLSRRGTIDATCVEKAINRSMSTPTNHGRFMPSEQAWKCRPACHPITYVLKVLDDPGDRSEQ